MDIQFSPSPSSHSPFRDNMDIQFSPSPSSHSPFRDNMDILNMESVAANLFPVTPPAVAGCSQEEGLEALGNVLMRKLQHLVGELANIPKSHTRKNILDSLTPNVRKRVEGLRQLQVQRYELVAMLRKERDALEAKYLELCDPLYTERCDIVNGVVEAEGVTSEVATDAPKGKGVPNFWMNAMKNHELLAEEITEHDEGILKYLKDIKFFRLENLKGYKLEFVFDTNPFFKNGVLTKTYHMADEDDSILLKAIGTEIEWYPGKRLPERSLKKKPNRGSKPIANKAAYKSFFNFFSPPRLHMEDAQRDFDVGFTIRDKIIPRAVAWFTRDALQEDGEYEEEDEDDWEYDKYLYDGDEGRHPLEDQSKLPDLAGKHANSLESLSPDIWKRLEELRQLQGQRDKLQVKFLEERAVLKAKYQKLCEPIYNERYKIVNGLVEEGVTDEVAADEQGATDASKEKGVPNFWLNAMKNNKYLAREIRKHDEVALQYLKDIKCRSIGENLMGFKLEFFFGTNPFFKNNILTKTYHMIDDFIMEKATGTQIRWYHGKSLTHKVPNNLNNGLKVPKLISCVKTRESFFNFFGPSRCDDYDEERQHDYNVGYVIQTEIVPDAVCWFTGEAHEEYKDV